MAKYGYLFLSKEEDRNVCNKEIGCVCERSVTNAILENPRCKRGLFGGLFGEKGVESWTIVHLHLTNFQTRSLFNCKTSWSSILLLLLE
jgi:hypothetical protein